MDIHLYVDFKAISQLDNYLEVIAHTKEGKQADMVHVSFDLNTYTVSQVPFRPHLYKVSKTRCN